MVWGVLAVGSGCRCRVRRVGCCCAVVWGDVGGGGSGGVGQGGRAV